LGFFIIIIIEGFEDSGIQGSEDSRVSVWWVIHKSPRPSEPARLEPVVPPGEGTVENDVHSHARPLAGM
jgi:hypothetical protein